MTVTVDTRSNQTNESHPVFDPQFSVTTHICLGLATICVKGLEGDRFYHPERMSPAVALREKLEDLNKDMPIESVRATMTDSELSLANFAVGEQLRLTLSKPNGWGHLDGYIENLQRLCEALSTDLNSLSTTI